MRALSFEFSRKSLIFLRIYSFPKKFVSDRFIFGPSRPGVSRRHFESWILQIDSQLENDWFCNEDLDKTDVERYQEVLQNVRNPSHPKFFQQIQGFRRCKIKHGASGISSEITWIFAPYHASNEVKPMESFDIQW